MTFAALLGDETDQHQGLETDACARADSFPGDELHTVRQSGLVALATGSAATALVVLILALGFGGSAWMGALASAGLAGLVAYLAWRKDVTERSRMIAGIAVSTLPTALIMVFWSIELSHSILIPFLVALPVLGCLCDLKVMRVATILSLGQFLVLRYSFMERFGTLPTSVAETLGTFVMETLGLVIVGGVGMLLASSICNLVTEIGEARSRSEMHAADLSRASAALEQALEDAKMEQEETRRAREQAAHARKAASDAIAEDFERSVSAVTSSVSQTAQMLHKSARSLKALAERTGDDSLKVVAAAETASKKANTVAAGLAELSLSVAEIAAHSGRQAELAATAKKKSSSGGAVIASLSEQSKTMVEATKSIVRVAERTDLLSLNAAIEAASAGNSGRGFTIVAQEVKQLAGQAGAAASQIDEFLKGVRTGTLETERSFHAIDDAIAKLGEVATSISYDIENQRQSANTIEDFAREAARDADEMVGSVKTVADRAMAARRLSDELDRAAQALADNAKNLERSSRSFTENLKAA
jgi:methyl-accepting chemotaxis protein